MSNKITDIKERILYFAENQENRKQDFFRKTELNYGNFTGESKKRPINSNSIEVIMSKYPEIDANWLITGQGNMLRVPQDKIVQKGNNIMNNGVVNGDINQFKPEAQQIIREQQREIEFLKKDNDRLEQIVDILRNKQ